MNILVTGGAGFIGSTVVDHYIKAGHAVCAVDNESSGHRKNVNSQARYWKVDINDVRKLRSLFEKSKFDVVCHHAAQIDVRKSVEDPVLDATINILGLLKVLQLCKEFGVKKILFLSL